MHQRILSAPSSKYIKAPITSPCVHRHLLGISHHPLFLNYGYSSYLFFLLPYWLQYSQNKLLNLHSLHVRLCHFLASNSPKVFPVTQNKIQRVDRPLISLISPPSLFLSHTSPFSVVSLPFSKHIKYNLPSGPLCVWCSLPNTTRPPIHTWIPHVLQDSVHNSPHPSSWSHSAAFFFIELLLAGIIYNWKFVCFSRSKM